MEEVVVLMVVQGGMGSQVTAVWEDFGPGRFTPGLDLAIPQDRSAYGSYSCFRWRTRRRSFSTSFSRSAAHQWVTLSKFRFTRIQRSL